MTIRKTDAYAGSAALRRVLFANDSGNSANTVDAKALEGMLRDAGPAGAPAIRAAYEAAKENVGGAPTFDQVREELRLASASLADTYGDAYVDDFEAARAGPVALELYGYTETIAPATPRTKATLCVTEEQLDEAMKVSRKVIDRAVALYRPDTHASFSDALRQAAKELGVPKAADLLIAASDSRADEKLTLREAKELRQHIMSDPYRFGLYNAADALRAADGEAIVDFERPSEKAPRVRDGVVTDLELDRRGARELTQALFDFATTL